MDRWSYTSARINTKGHAAFYPGMTTSDGRTWNTIHIEARVKTPEPGTGLWAAFWLFPEVCGGAEGAGGGGGNMGACKAVVWWK